MIKPLARLVFRGSGKNDGLIIGSSIKEHNFFKPNTVYELREVLGEVVIKEVGPSWLGDRKRQEWSRTIGDILDIHGSRAFLSKEEYAHECGLKTKKHESKTKAKK
jgi:hypothetical protein